MLFNGGDIMGFLTIPGLLAAAEFAGGVGGLVGGISSLTAGRGDDSAAQAAQRRSEKRVSDLEAQQKKEESGEKARRVRDEARDRQLKRAAAAQGRRSTILTGPLDSQGGAAPVQRKTLLGT